MRSFKLASCLVARLALRKTTQVYMGIGFRLCKGLSCNTEHLPDLWRQLLPLIIYTRIHRCRQAKAPPQNQRISRTVLSEPSYPFSAFSSSFSSSSSHVWALFYYFSTFSLFYFCLDLSWSVCFFVIPSSFSYFIHCLYFLASLPTSYFLFAIYSYPYSFLLLPFSSSLSICFSV